MAALYRLHDVMLNFNSTTEAMNSRIDQDLDPEISL